jgi:hypothetical protein
MIHDPLPNTFQVDGLRLEWRSDGQCNFCGLAHDDAVPADYQPYHLQALVVPTWPNDPAYWARPVDPSQVFVAATPTPPASAAALLAKREATHGDFGLQARTAQALETAFWAGAEAAGKERKTSPCQTEALHMIFTKLARIAAGNASCIDHWADIGGYAELMVRELRKQDCNA